MHLESFSSTGIGLYFFLDTVLIFRRLVEFAGAHVER